jgi:mRNA interferase MazF
MVMSNIPDRGDLVWVNFNPQSGLEQAGHRPALVISPKLYHANSKLVTLCPITSSIQPWPWKVMLPEKSPIAGAVLTDQIRSVDREARKLKIIGKADSATLKDVLAKISVLLGIE